MGRVVSVGTEGEGEGLRAPSSPSLTRPHPAGRVASFSMPSSSSRYALGPSLLRGHEVGERVQSNEMGTSVLIMQPILRFLQLLCENHNRDLQVRPGPYAPPHPGSAPPRAPPFPHAPPTSLSAPPCPGVPPRPYAPPAPPRPGLRPSPPLHPPPPRAPPTSHPAPPPETYPYSAPPRVSLGTTVCGSEAGEAPIPAAHMIMVPRRALPPC